MQSFFCRSVIGSTSRRTILARTTRQQPVIYRQSGSPRFASTSAASSSSTSESKQVPASSQPTTSPDKQHDPLSHPAGSDGKNTGSKNAATVSDKAEEGAQGMDDGHTLMSEQEKEILAKLQKEFPGGSVAVQDVSGGCGTFFAISIESDKFKGLSKIKQHQKVNKVLEDEVKTWHGMQLKTMAL